MIAHDFICPENPLRKLLSQAVAALEAARIASDHDLNCRVTKREGFCLRCAELDARAIDLRCDFLDCALATASGKDEGHKGRRTNDE
jgi:hypothetical protein